MSEALSFDSFLEQFRAYVEDYFTKRIILVNKLRIHSYDGGDILLFVLDTPETDVLLQVFTPDLVIMDAHVAGRVNPKRLSYEQWRGMRLSKGQYEEFVRLFRKALEHYERNKEEFKRARVQAFLNLVRETRGEILDILSNEFGEDLASKVVATELGLLRG